MKQRIVVQADAAFNRAMALQRRGDLPGAETIYRALLRQYPNHFRTLGNLGELMLQAGRCEEAVDVLRRALKQQPNSAPIQAMLAYALRDLEEYEEALKRARRAVALDPEFAHGHAVLARVLADLGRYDEALPTQARAIELAPDRVTYYYDWGEMARWTPGDPRLAALEALAQKASSLPPGEQVRLHFALGQAYAEGGDIDRAFRHQIAGGALQRHMLKYNEASYLRLLDELRVELDAGWMELHRGMGDPSPLPLFIVGMPRSGTTLVEQILANHPHVRALGERTYFERSLCKICGTPGIPLSIAQIAKRWSQVELRKLGAFYVADARQHAPASAARLTDKLPANFRFVGLIHAALPNARIIHVRRDPVDTCLSIFSKLFAQGHQAYSYELGELGRYYRAYEKMMAHWRNVLPPSVMIEVQYEEIVEDCAGQARRISAHCGLQWDDACLEFYKADRAVRTSSHAQVRQPIYRTSVGRERPPGDLLLPLLEALGLENA